MTTTGIRSDKAPQRTGCPGVPAKGQGENFASGLVLGAETSPNTERGKPGLPASSSRSRDPQGDRSRDGNPRVFGTCPEAVLSASVSPGQVSPGGRVCGLPAPVTLQRRNVRSHQKVADVFILPNKGTLEGSCTCSHQRLAKRQEPGRSGTLLGYVLRPRRSLVNGTHFPFQQYIHISRFPHFSHCTSDWFSRKRPVTHPNLIVTEPDDLSRRPLQLKPRSGGTQSVGDPGCSGAPGPARVAGRDGTPPPAGHVTAGTR